jgi:hypothetical protein
MRVIQYAAAFRLNPGRWWNTGSSAFADDDGPRCGALAHNELLEFKFQTAGYSQRVCDLAAPAREFHLNVLPSEFRGRRECRAPTAPAASRAK